MRRVLGVICAAGMVCVPAPSGALAQTADPEPARRVFVLWLDGTTIGDWSDPALTNVARVLREGGAGVLSTATGSDADDVFEMRARSARALAALRGTVPFGVVAAPAEDGSRSPLERVACPQGPAACEITAPQALRADPGFPTGRRANITALRLGFASVVRDGRVIVVDVGDAGRVERALGDDPAARAPWIALAMRRADQMLGTILAAARPGDTVMLVSAMTTVQRQREGLRLGAIALMQPGGPRGLLTSDTTRIAGSVARADIARAIISLLRSGSPAPIRIAHDRAGAARARGVERSFVVAARARAPLSAATFAMASAVMLLAFVLVASGRGKPAHAGAVPKGARDWTATAAAAILATPMAMIVTGAIGPDSTATTALLTGGITAGAAVGARAAFGRAHLVSSISIVTFVLLLADGLTHGAFSAGAILGSPLAGGERSGGADAAIVACASGALAFAAAYALDRAERFARATRVVAAASVIALVAFAPSPFGDLPSSIAIVVAASTPMLARALGASWLQAAIASAGAAVLAGGAVALGRDAALDISDLTAIARARADAFVSVALSGWTLGLLCVAAPPAYLRARRRSLVDRAMWGRPFLRAAITGCAAAAIAATILAPGGLIGAAWLALYASAAAAIVLLLPDA